MQIKTLYDLEMYTKQRGLNIGVPVFFNWILGELGKGRSIQQIANTIDEYVV